MIRVWSPHIHFHLKQPCNTYLITLLLETCIYPLSMFCVILFDLGSCSSHIVYVSCCSFYRSKLSKHMLVSTSRGRGVQAMNSIVAEEIVQVYSKMRIVGTYRKLAPHEYSHPVLLQPHCIYKHP